MLLWDNANVWLSPLLRRRLTPIDWLEDPRPQRIQHPSDLLRFQIEHDVARLVDDATRMSGVQLFLHGIGARNGLHERLREQRGRRLPGTVGNVCGDMRNGMA